ncbi:hypothetical protein OGAPHI_000873 [Ogataea philodendri]|uniref:Zn(2)-C6 fungal-type domain-containing protein n=1 Tax=Ogataea philodendri TaxID=1378263 RepID=A0A9P8PFM4_9ASCO|nr:uncharacterized protein OGAPHI_000873 [Ogataea philodendri]KAH3671162.1 hypothetical protein OGAPHI_000873 [Ogataea philodendri]
MDEIIDFESLKLHTAAGYIRASNRCFTCKAKRQHCDYKYPVCSNCAKNNTDCMAWAKGSKSPIPRSIACYLEKRVAQLELEAHRLRTELNPEHLDDKENIAANLSSKPFSGVCNSEKDDIGDESFGFLYFRSSNLPAPFDCTLHSSDRGNIRTFMARNPMVDIYSIPSKIADIILQNYLDIHLPQYPIVSSEYVRELKSSVFEKRNTCGPYEKAVMGIILAMSTATLSYKGEKGALASSGALFSYFLSQILQVEWSDKLKKLQILLLVAHYAFSNPYAADSCYAMKEALRISVEMGLHKELDFDHISPLIMQTRRRLFMVCMNMARHVFSVNKRMFPIPSELISFQLPEAVDDHYITDSGIDLSGPPTKAAAIHFYRFRLYETEIYDVLWGHKSIKCGLKEWVQKMSNNLDSWLSEANHFSTINQLKYRAICHASGHVRLYSRSPRKQWRNREDALLLMESVIKCLDEYLVNASTGWLAYLMAGVFHVEELTVCLLDIMWNESNWIFDHYSQAYISTQVIQCIGLLQQFSLRWPDIEKSKMVSYLSNLHLKITSQLEHGFVIDPHIISQLNFLIFPQVSTGYGLDSLPEDTVDLDHNFIQMQQWNDNFTSSLSIL